MRTPVVALVTVLFSGTPEAIPDHRNTVALEQACECAKVHLLQSNAELALEATRMNDAWEMILKTTTGLLAQLRNSSNDMFFSSLVHLAPVIDVANVYNGLTAKQKQAVAANLGSPQAAFFQEYFGAKRMVIDQFVEEILQIVGTVLELPTLTKDNIDEYLQSVTTALTARKVPAVDELEACWQHIEAMTGRVKQDVPHEMTRASIAEQMYKSGISIKGLRKDCKQQVAKLKELVAGLLRLEKELQDSGPDLIMSKGTMLEKTKAVQSMAEQQLDSLNTVYKTIEYLDRRTRRGNRQVSKAETRVDECKCLRLMLLIHLLAMVILGIPLGLLCILNHCH